VCVEGHWYNRRDVRKKKLIVEGASRFRAPRSVVAQSADDGCNWRQYLHDNCNKYAPHATVDNYSRYYCFCVRAVHVIIIVLFCRPNQSAISSSHSQILIHLNKRSFATVFRGTYLHFSRDLFSTPRARLYACVRLLNSVRVPHRGDQHDRVGGDARRSSGRKFAADRGRAPSLVGGGRKERV